MRLTARRVPCNKQDFLLAIGPNRAAGNLVRPPQHLAAPEAHTHQGILLERGQQCRERPLAPYAIACDHMGMDHHAVAQPSPTGVAPPLRGITTAESSLAATTPNPIWLQRLMNRLID